MQVADAAARALLADLADRLEEGQALDVAHRAADLDEHEVVRVVAVEHERLDGVGDVRDHLDRGAEIVAAPLLGDDVEVDPPRRHVVGARGRQAGEALVMAQIQIGLGAVVGDEDLAVLGRAHRARIDVEIGVELAQPHAIAARLEQGREGGGGETLAQGGNHAAGDEDVPRHGLWSIKGLKRFAKPQRMPHPAGHAGGCTGSSPSCR